MAWDLVALPRCEVAGTVENGFGKNKNPVFYVLKQNILKKCEVAVDAAP
jgi:hypothetical protein